MPQSYTKSEKNTARKNEKNSEKEILDRKSREFFSSKSTIKRAPHDSAHFYLKLSVNLIKDKRVSNDCFRMLTLLLSKSDGWEIIPSVLAQELSEYEIGFNKTYALISEAMSLGYMKREVIKNGNLFSRYEYFISEEPIFSNNSSAITGFVITEPVKHIKYQPKELSLEKEVVEATSSPPPSSTTSVPQKKEKIPKKSLRRDITELEKQALYAKYPKNLVDEKLKNLETTMKTHLNGYKNKDPYREVVRWCEEAMSKKAKTFSGEKKMDDQKPNELYTQMESHALSEEMLIKRFIENNLDLKEHIKWQKEKRNVDVRNTLNSRRYDTIVYPDPYLQSKLDRWAEEYRKTHRIASSCTISPLEVTLPI
jgi:hypothetical protein